MLLGLNQSLFFYGPHYSEALFYLVYLFFICPWAAPTSLELPIKAFGWILNSSIHPFICSAQGLFHICHRASQGTKYSSMDEWTSVTGSVNGTSPQVTPTSTGGSSVFHPGPRFHRGSFANPPRWISKFGFHCEVEQYFAICRGEIGLQSHGA